MIGKEESLFVSALSVSTRLIWGEPKRRDMGQIRSSVLAAELNLAFRI